MRICIPFFNGTLSKSHYDNTFYTYTRELLLFDMHLRSFLKITETNQALQ